MIIVIIFYVILKVSFSIVRTTWRLGSLANSATSFPIWATGVFQIFQFLSSVINTFFY
jgi:hypothetical protein